jgi:single-strand DNA-binding protein
MDGTMTYLTMTGNATSDPELRYTQSGKAVANFSIASSDRVYDKTTNDWKDGEAVYMRIAVWGQQAERVAAALTKGKRVTVSGKLRQGTYEDKNGAHRSYYEIDADDVALSLKFTPYELAEGSTAATAPWSTSDQYSEASAEVPF